ncbi:MAG: glycosyltransferase [Firmicutes bacterium]|nr:glycosyltransferase [Bacillota bacterium]
MKVLLLSVTAGQGHHQTAMAISEELTKRGMQCETLDILKYIDPIICEVVSKSYLMSTKHLPIAYGSFYSLAERNEAKKEKLLSRLTSTAVSKRVAKYIEQSKPDVIICTHVFAAQVLTHVEKFNGLTIGIVTDFTIHPYWEETALDFYVIASELLMLHAEKKGIDAGKLLPIGIPIHEKFSGRIPKAEARKQLGIKDKITILVMSGSMGYGNIVQHIKRMDTVNLDFQILCVCGKNLRAKKNIYKIETTREIYAYGYVDNIDIMMDAADVIITKPGGLTVSEALAKRLPMILINPIPGQEVRNTEFLLNNAGAMKMSKTCPADICLYQILINDRRRAILEDIMGYIGKPHAARELGDFLVSYGKNKPS